MTPEIFTNHALPPRRQLEAWRGWFDTLFDVLPREPVDEGFVAESRLWSLNGFAIGSVAAPALYATRTKSLIRRNPVDHWVLGIGRRASSRIIGQGVMLEVPPDTPFIQSLGQEVTSERAADERLHLYLSRDAFQDIAPQLDAACGRLLSAPLGHLLKDYLFLLDRHLPDLTEDEQPRLTHALRAMIGACVAPSPDWVARASDQIDLCRMERVRQIVRKQLRSPDLGPAVLCRELGISRTHLYRLMESEGGVFRYIQRQRLLESFTLLSDWASITSIGALAEEMGFSDTPSFSRAFRREFGMSPRDARVASLLGPVPLPRPDDQSHPRSRSLSDCLRDF
ncbi:MAG TPA: helix-turn-helix domain-containing protein [Roseomonas sp.]